MIAIDGLTGLRARLDELDLDAAIGRGLAAAARHLAEDVRTLLSTPPGGPHAMPWRQSGALAESIVAGETIVASTSDVAVYQELGTARIPPRPFLLPAATAHVADEIAAAIAQTGPNS